MGKSHLKKRFSLLTAIQSMVAKLVFNDFLMMCAVHTVHATQTGQFSEKSHHECSMKSLYIDKDLFNNVNTKETKNTVQFLEEQLRVRLLLVLGKCETMNIESI